jgi:ankyrin repeat protein
MGKTYPSVDSIKNLIEKGVDVNCDDENGMTPLLYLVEKKLNIDDKSSLLELLEFLIEKGIDVNCKDQYGDNALTLLCWKYRNENLIDIIRLLIEKGIDVNYKDINVLCQNYRKENRSQIVDLLKQHTHSTFD